MAVWITFISARIFHLKKIIIIILKKINKPADRDGPQKGVFSGNPRIQVTGGTICGAERSKVILSLTGRWSHLGHTESPRWPEETSSGGWRCETCDWTETSLTFSQTISWLWSGFFFIFIHLHTVSKIRAIKDYFNLSAWHVVELVSNIK